MKYLVALSTGGLMESPEMYYENFQIIEASSEDEAREIYNRENNCAFYYGAVLGEYTDKLSWLIGHRPIEQDVVDELLGVQNER